MSFETDEKKTTNYTEVGGGDLRFIFGLVTSQIQHQFFEKKQKKFVEHTKYTQFQVHISPGQPPTTPAHKHTHY